VRSKSAPLHSAAPASLKKTIGAVLLGGGALVALHDWVAVGGSGWDLALNGVVYDSVVVAAGFACLLRAGEVEAAARTAWLAMAAAVFAWAAGEIYWTAAIEGNPSAPYPSPADIGYLGFYPLAILGLYKLVSARAHQLDWRLWADGLIAALGTASLGAALIFEFVADHTSGSPLQIATTLAYPLGDIVLVAIVIGVVALTGWRPGRTWSLLLAGLAAMAVADVAFTLQTYEATLPGGDWVEPLYLLSAMFIGAVAWQPRAETIRPEAGFDGLRELVVPTIVAAVMIALVAMQYFSGATVLTTFLWSATMLAVIVRLALSVRENKRLIEQVRTDALTGLGNQGSLQVDLATHCESAAAAPFTLLLLDLNGFKKYNDTFGHPAGDEMLTRLGGRLRTAVGKAGSAYRTGGDEFVVLLTCDAPERERVTKQAAEALTARGRGYELSASWGGAHVPEEATTPIEALRLADVRMYAQKESRRLAHVPAIELESDGEMTVSSDRTRDREALEHRD
jgi:diguanylate cyclase (GGDEF)-like protein